ncbi:MAG: archaellum operon transcriptional activator EarA family protein [Methanocella sp.]
MDKLQSIERCGHDLYKSLSRSKIRRDILIFLRKNPDNTTIFEISRNIKASYTNTKGAILGYGKGYKEERSLASLGLVISENGRSSVNIILSPRGHEIAKLLEE